LRSFWAEIGIISWILNCTNKRLEHQVELPRLGERSNFGGIWANVKAILFSTYANPTAAKRLETEKGKPHGPLAHLVQLGLAKDLGEKTAA
jgi:hypothetical protein